MTQNRRIRVMLIAPHFAEYTLYLADSLCRHVDLEVGFNSANLAAEVMGAPVKAGQTQPFAVFTFLTKSKPYRWLAVLRILVQLLRRRPDIVHFQESSNELTILAEPLARLFAPVVLTIHDPLPHMGRDAYALKAWKHRLKLRRRAALNLVHGAHCLAEIHTEAAGAVTRAGVTRHGVILLPPPQEQREPQPGALLMFGRMEAYKGLEVLIDACERLRDRGVAFALTLAGKGPELDRLRGRIDTMPQIKVLDGWLTPLDAIREFQKAALVVLPYLEATQSGVLAAAVANGRPVVASDVGGIPDVVVDGRTGVLTPPGDAGALADALGRLLGEPATLARMGAAAAGLADADLNWDDIAAETAQMYHDLLRARD
jgi:glycosyltransferase involved in cell wall biosynthesis